MRQLRAALVLLDGDRSAFGFPNQPPFNCTWKEAVGANQATYAEGVGWTPSAIQLECSDFDPIRFHVRLFPAGEWTIANAHFEVLIPGTNVHEILSWELAEQLVTVDIMRSWLLDGAAPLGSSWPINPAPSYRTIQPLVYNGLPPALKVLLTGSPADVAEPVPVATDGQATILNLSGEATAERTVAARDYDLQFNQVIPKPFCASGPFDWILVQGPVRFRQRVVLTHSGNFLSHFHATGALELTPVNPLTNPPTPVGEPYRAQVNEHYKNIVTDHVTLVSNLRLQVLIPPSGPFRGSLHASLRLGAGATEASDLIVRCGSLSESERAGAGPPGDVPRRAFEVSKAVAWRGAHELDGARPVEPLWAGSCPPWGCARIGASTRPETGRTPTGTSGPTHRWPLRL